MKTEIKRRGIFAGKFFLLPGILFLCGGLLASAQEKKEDQEAPVKVESVGEAAKERIADTPIEDIPDNTGDDSHYTLLHDDGVEVVNDGTSVVKPLTSVVDNPDLLPEITRRKMAGKYVSTSPSKQFLAISSRSNARLCSSLSSLGDEVKEELLSLLKEKDGYKGKITLILEGEPGDPLKDIPISAPKALINEGDVPISYEITIQVGRGVDQTAIRYKLMELILYERALRNTPTDLLPGKLQIPSWLVSGINESIMWKKDLIDRNLYATLFERGDIFTLDKLFSVKDPFNELDASTLGIYRASSGALMLSLLNQAGGMEALKRMLDQSILSPVDGETLLKQNFPGLHLSKNSLYKWWALQVSQLSMRPMTEALTLLETENLLAEYSKTPYYDSEFRTMVNVGPENYKILLGMHPSVRNSLLQPMIVNLVQLSYRAFPAQRDLVMETLVLTESILKEKIPKDMDKRLARLKEQREAFKKLGARTRDYMDWYTIISTTKSSGSFDNYTRAMRLLRETKQPTRNEMSKYLDDIEKMASSAE